MENSTKLKAQMKGREDMKVILKQEEFLAEQFDVDCPPNLSPMSDQCIVKRTICD